MRMAHGLPNPCEPYISYGLVAWGQAVNRHLNKIFTLQMQVLHLMYQFSDYKAHSAPLFVNSGILPIKLLYFKSEIHSYSTRSSAAGNFHIKTSRTNQQLFSNSIIGANIWNGIPLKVNEIGKAPFKRNLKHMLLQILQTGD